MSLLDGILSQVSSNADVQNLAAKVGITPEQAESAIMALAQSHTAPGDTVEGAAASTGLGSDVLSQIVGHIGGEGSLGQFATLINGAENSGILAAIRRFLASMRGDLPLAAKVNALLAAPEGRRDWALTLYSRERLFSVQARLGYLPPDLAS